MDDIWQQFHRLPKAIKDAVAKPSALEAVDRLEQQYPGVDLANFVMRVMVKAVPLRELPNVIQSEGKVSVAAATAISAELEKSVFSQAAEYVGVRTVPTTVQAAAKPVPAAPAPTIPQSVPVPPNLPMAASATPLVRSATLVSLVPLPTPVMTTPKPMIQPSAASPSRPVGAMAPTQAYSEEDAAEIRNSADRLRQFQSAAPLADFEQTAIAILAEQHLAFPDELMSRRAVAIVKARLKGIRDTAATKDMLARAPKVGGLGLDPDMAEQVALRIDREAVQMKDRGMVRAPVPDLPPPPPRIPAAAIQHPTPMPPLQKILPPTEVNISPVPLPNFTEAPRASQPIKRPADIPSPPSMESPKSSPTPRTSIPSAISRPVIQRGRSEGPKMSDVSQPAQVLGPAEEMRTLTLTQFRRLGQGAGDSTRHLLAKFHNLQKESFTLWAEAIASWRQSEVYRIYLDMGRQSLDSGIPITQVVQQRAQANQPYLSEHEFSVVADLNRQLQY